jgi:ParB family chromosome partitioning protein
MSLVENCARRQHRAIDLLHDIEGLKNRGYEFEEIARKTGLTVEYVRGVASLLENGEHRLLRAVEAGHRGRCNRGVEAMKALARQNVNGQRQV